MATYFGARFRKTVLTIHVICCSIWIGAAIAMVVLIFARDSFMSSDDSFAGLWQAVKKIDDYVIIASAGASLVSGGVLAWGTPWGFFKWHWVATKLIATVVLVAFGAFFLGPWINRSAAISTKQGLAANADQDFQQASFLVSTFGTLQIVALVLIFVISVFKPWGKIGKRKRKSISGIGHG